MIDYAVVTRTAIWSWAECGILSVKNAISLVIFISRIHWLGERDGSKLIERRSIDYPCSQAGEYSCSEVVGSS